MTKDAIDFCEHSISIVAYWRANPKDDPQIAMLFQKMFSLIARANEDTIFELRDLASGLDIWREMAKHALGMQDD